MAPLDHARRLAWASEHLGGAGYDRLLLTSRDNIRWLTGFTGSNGWVLVARDELVLITDGRYGEQATEQMQVAGVPGRVLIGATRQLMTEHLAREAGRTRLGFEGAHISYASTPRSPALSTPSGSPRAA